MFTRIYLFIFTNFEHGFLTSKGAKKFIMNRSNAFHFRDVNGKFSKQKYDNVGIFCVLAPTKYIFSR